MRLTWIKITLCKVVLIGLVGCNQLPHTNDSRVFAPITDFSYSITMSSSTHGWAFGKDILVTNDGGVKWVNVTPHIFHNNISSYEHFVLDKDKAWLAVQKENLMYLFKTIDGGINWSESLLPFDVNNTGEYKLFFINKNECWFSQTISAGLGYSKLIISRTTDGGETWMEITSEESLNKDGNKDFGYFINSEKGWISVHDITKTPYMYFTQNSGLLWDKFLIPYKSNTEISLFSTSLPQFFDDKNGSFILYTVTNHGDLVEIYYYKSIDFGLNWEQNYIIQAVATQFYQPMYSFVDINTGWLSIDGKSILRTIDGKNWENVINIESFVGSYLSIVEFQFVTKNKGWLILNGGEKNQLFITNNGGENWTLIHPKKWY